MNKIMLASLLFLAACQSRNIVTEHGEISGSQGQTSEPNKSGSETPAAPTETATPKPPSAHEDIRLGIILGAGGAKTFAEIGFLKELQSRKIPVQAIVGMEWGALVAASFAAKGSAHEAEWQLSKMKDMGSSWLGKNQNNLKDALDPLKAFLSSFSADNMKVPFACPSLNLKKSQMFMMARGRLDQLLPYCLPYPPNFAPFERNIAAPREIQVAADFLRHQGANYIVLVNVLAGESQNEPINWLELGYDMKRKWPGVHERLDIVIKDNTINDFNSRQDLIQLGSEQSAAFADKLMNRF
jgi:NTE family protein